MSLLRLVFVAVVVAVVVDVVAVAGAVLLLVAGFALVFNCLIFASKKIPLLLLILQISHLFVSVIPFMFNDWIFHSFKQAS